MIDGFNSNYSEGCCTFISCCNLNNNRICSFRRDKIRLYLFIFLKKFKNYMRQYLSKTIYLIIIFIFTSCREDIIVPGNFAGNVNEPIQESKLNYYNFLISAQNLSTRFSAKTNFYYSTTKILFTITDIENGSVNIGVKDENGATLYNSFIQTDVQSQYGKISGAIPDRIDISCNNFTGKIRLSLYYSSD